MCGRFVSSLPPQEVARWFRTKNLVPNTPPRFNAAPTQDVLAVRYNPKTGERSLDAIRWGLVPHWAKDLSIGSKLINARAEGIAEKPAFRDAFLRRRCLIPSNGFYEWRKDAKPKQPYLVALKDEEIFAFAGLWENWRDKEHGGEWVRTCTIVTARANEVVAPIHSRMPVILDPQDYATWLGETGADHDELLGLLKPFPAERAEAYPVGPAVNSVRNDDPSLLEPVLP